MDDGSNAGRREPVRELPPDTSPWVNRVTPLDVMTKTIVDTTPRQGPRLLVVHGTDAIGKTAFVVKCATPLEDEHFPDGSLYFDVQDAAVDGVVSVHEVLCGLLEAIEDDSDSWPDSVGGLARRWRRLTASRRMLIVLDNLEDPAILRQILPNGRDVTVVVVSRYNDLEFIAMGAKPIELKQLEPGHGVELLGHFSGRERIEAEPVEAAKLAEMCHGRPQLIRLVGASLVAAPDKSLATCRAEITAGAGPVAAQLTAASRAIVAHALAHNVFGEDRELLKALSRFPGRDFRTELASWLHRADATGPLATLAQAQLVVPAGADRWSLASAVADYDFGDDADGVFDRVVDWYLGSARLCDELVMGPGRLLINELVDTDSPLLFRPDDAAAASRWFFAEQHTLFKLQRHSFDTGRYHAVWALEEALWVLYQTYRPVDSWQLTAPLAIRAAAADGDPAAEARMRDQYVYLLIQLGRFDEAATEAEAAEALAKRTDNRRLAASTVEFRGMVHKHLGEFGTAIEHFTAALAVNEALGRGRAVALQRRLIGECRLALGDLDAAGVELSAALASFTAAASTHHIGRTLRALARLDATRGDVDATRSRLAEVAAAFTAAGTASVIPVAYEECGDVFAAAGSIEPARSLWTTALEYHRADYDGDGEAAKGLRRKLDDPRR